MFGSISGSKHAILNTQRRERKWKEIKEPKAIQSIYWWNQIRLQLLTNQKQKDFFFCRIFGTKYVGQVSLEWKQTFVFNIINANINKPRTNGKPPAYLFPLNIVK